MSFISKCLRCFPYSYSAELFFKGCSVRSAQLTRRHSLIARPYDDDDDDDDDDRIDRKLPPITQILVSKRPGPVAGAVERPSFLPPSHSPHKSFLRRPVASQSAAPAERGCVTDPSAGVAVLHPSE